MDARFGDARGGIQILVLALELASVAACGASPAPSAVEATTASSDAHFVLVLHSAKGTYRPDEAVEVSATLTYSGPDASIEIFQPFEGPIGFGVTETLGPVQLSPAWRLSCGSETLAAQRPIVKAFTKSGGPAPSASISFDDLNSFMISPELRLPAGVWHMYAETYFSTGGCGGDTYALRATLTITSQP